MPTLVPLAEIAEPDVETLLDQAFGTDRHARTAYRIRNGTAWLRGTSFAALDDDDWLIGTIQCWPVALTDPGGRAHPLIMVGPVAVLPEQQGEGYGKALMLAALGAIDAADAPLPQVMIGDPEYYGRFFGFDAAPAAGWRCPGPYDQRRLLARAVNPAVLPGEGMLGPWVATP